MSVKAVKGKKKAVVKKSTAKRATKKVAPPEKPRISGVVLQPEACVSVPMLKLALVAAVDNPQQWLTAGHPPKELPKLAQLAAKLCQHGCFFCGGKFVEHLPDEEVNMFHPAYPLCDCLLSQRKVAHDFIVGWNETDASRLQFQTKVFKGDIKRDAPVYQYVCTKCSDVCVVNAWHVAMSLKKGNKQKYQRCISCHMREMSSRSPAQPLKASLGDIAQKPAAGPAAPWTPRSKYANKKRMSRTDEGMATPIPEGTLPTIAALTEGAPTEA